MKQYTLQQIRTDIIKLSQEKLAHSLGISLASWSLKEQYKRSLKATELIKLSEMAKLDPREIKLG